MPVPAHALNVPRDLAFNFFVMFSRLEFALKACGYGRVSGQDGVDIDWARFAREAAPAFDPGATPALQSAVAYLLAEPPQKEVIRHNKLDWDPALPAEQEPQLHRITIFVRRVRNNLFHGGKFVRPESGDPGRDAKLVKASLYVIEALAESLPDVRDAFHA